MVGRTTATGGDSVVLAANMGVSINGGTPQWLVYPGNPIKMDDLGVALFQEISILP